MINEDDKEVLNELLFTECAKLKCTKDTIMNAERVIFGDFFNGIDGENRPFV